MERRVPIGTQAASSDNILEGLSAEILATRPEDRCVSTVFLASQVSIPCGSISISAASFIGKSIHPDLRIHVALQPLPLTSTFSATRRNPKHIALRMVQLLRTTEF